MMKSGDIMAMEMLLEEKNSSQVKSLNIPKQNFSKTGSVGPRSGMPPMSLRDNSLRHSHHQHRGLQKATSTATATATADNFPAATAIDEEPKGALINFISIRV
ncbi:hypothetical protein Sjap_026357 [Stephania japonica]|uniref:Uncharacterized protein n=1 Tax=Stephania japonica TaxID=461633 RepID=A0AAP0E3F8_9MAGN